MRGIVQRSGRRFGHLDGTHVDTVPALHAALAAALDFPSYYGHNLDALADVLGDLPSAPGTQPVLLWDSWGVCAEVEPRTCTIVLELLGASVTTLLRGPGPGAVLRRSAS